MSMTRVPSDFLQLLANEGVSLHQEGVVDVALTPSVAKQAIALLRFAGVAVIGGEVWEKRGDSFFPTYDIWNVEEDDYSSQEKYVKASLDIADQQVQKYLKSKERVYVVLGI